MTTTPLTRARRIVVKVGSALLVDQVSGQVRLLPLEDELPDLPLDELPVARDRLVPPEEPLRLRFALLLPLGRFDDELPRRVPWEDRPRPELADLRPVCRERSAWPLSSSC